MEQMERIASFSVDHTRLDKGMYLSRVDGADIVTYDIRMKLPNQGDYFSTGGAHTFEHLFATCARNSDYSEHVVYVGPMGCRTGFYLVTYGLPHAGAIRLVQNAMAFIRDFSGEIPGGKLAECGNFADQNLPEARQVGADMATVLKNWTPEQLEYKYYL